MLSGGVSAGKLDLVPGVLREAGVVAHFHKVEMKPGKPVFFGTRERPDGRPPTLVFGLPGNPVSSFVCFELFVRPGLRRLRGHADSGPRWSTARAGRGLRLPHGSADVSPGAAGGRRRRLAQCGRCRGSARPDLRGLTAANALVRVAGRRSPARGGAGVFPVVGWRLRTSTGPRGLPPPARPNPRYSGGQIREAYTKEPATHGQPDSDRAGRHRVRPDAATPAAAVRLAPPACLTGDRRPAVAVLLPRRLGLARLGRAGPAAVAGAGRAPARRSIYLYACARRSRPSSGRPCSGCASPTTRMYLHLDHPGHLLLAIFPARPVL